MSQALFTMVPENQGPGANEIAVNAMLEALRDAGLIQGKYIAMAANLQQTAIAVDQGMRSGKITVATAQLNKMLMEGIDAMPETRAETSDAYDTLDAIISAMTKEALTNE